MKMVKQIMELKKLIEKVQDEESLKPIKLHQLSGNDFDMTLYLDELDEEQAKYAYLQKRMSECGAVENLKINLKEKTAIAKYKDFSATEKAFQEINEFPIKFNNIVIYEYLRNLDENKQILVEE